MRMPIFGGPGTRLNKWINHPGKGNNGQVRRETAHHDAGVVETRPRVRATDGYPRSSRHTGLAGSTSLAYEEGCVHRTRAVLHNRSVDRGAMESGWLGRLLVDASNPSGRSGSISDSETD